MYILYIGMYVPTRFSQLKYPAFNIKYQLSIIVRVVTCIKENGFLSPRSILTIKLTTIKTLINNENTSTTYNPFSFFFRRFSLSLLNTTNNNNSIIIITGNGTKTENENAMTMPMKMEMERRTDWPLVEKTRENDWLGLLPQLPTHTTLILHHIGFFVVVRGFWFQLPEFPRGF
jgi:hypothetical protein